MSTLKVNKIENTATTDGGIQIDSDGHVQVDGVQLPTAGALSNRNKIINGDMRIDQRNAGASVTINDAGAYVVDRWSVQEVADGALSVQRDTVAPAGFTNSLKVTVTTADTSLAASQYANIRQPIEGFNAADLAFGTASAATVTVSFWVRSSLTGTFGGALSNSAENRSYPFTYAIASANTWEQKTVAVVGDTSGTWLTDNGIGLWVVFGLGVGTDRSGTAGAWAAANYRSATGATSVIGTLNATFYITGVQLEVGDKATPFEHRSFGDELAKCQRYYQTTGNGANPTNAFGGAVFVTYPSNDYAYGSARFHSTMRANPTVVLYDNSGTSGTVTQNGTANGIAASASHITINGFSTVQKSSGTWFNDARYTIYCGYTASAEL